ncbi:SulA-like leucine-rich domain-containing protein [Nitrincola alkalilacustris]|uniref:SulA-like leucine-rich domain-containing protein n=1 Tax=Nitrincola alkalilacustris TaxID=1571224 RepID=UPI00124E99D2|nr:SulA-like leucine-rich domain-containing protein [Nitrincola alkalilacustris]
MFAIAAERDDSHITGQLPLTIEASADITVETRPQRKLMSCTQSRLKNSTQPSDQNLIQKKPSDPLSGKITEIVLHSDLVSLQPMILPMLSQLSHGERWLALVAPPSELTRNHLLQAATDLSRTLTLRCETDNAVELAAKALCAGTCHTVILWHPELTQQELQRLENAALAGGSHCLAIHGHSW